MCGDGAGGIQQILRGDAGLVSRPLAEGQHMQGEGEAVGVGVQRRCAEAEGHQFCCIRVEAAAVEQAIGAQVVVEGLAQGDGIPGDMGLGCAGFLPGPQGPVGQTGEIEAVQIIRGQTGRKIDAGRIGRRDDGGPSGLYIQGEEGVDGGLGLGNGWRRRHAIGDLVFRQGGGHVRHRCEHEGEGLARAIAAYGTQNLALGQVDDGGAAGRFHIPSPPKFHQHRLIDGVKEEIKIAVGVGLPAAQGPAALRVGKAVDRDLGIGDGAGLARDAAIDGHGRRVAWHQAGLCGDGVGGICQIRDGEAGSVLRAVGHCQHVQ